ncbi:MAG TPA: cytochrome c [Stellaceae bacterium]|jgi:cytochrome c556|nr:cytochrome c [Stellaceae bacterium]
MKAFSKCLLAAAWMVAVVGLTGAAWAQDADTVVKNRQELMKGQGKDLGAVKAYIDGKGDLAAAQAAAADLSKRLQAVPSAFPKGSGMAELPGKSYARPAIWTEWDKFSAADLNAQQKSVALESALKSGDKDKIGAAFADMGKNGCGGCHTPYREPKKS